MPKSYCTKCRTNWAALKETEIDDNFETHHVCPKCETSLWLEDAKEGEPLIPCRTFEPSTNILLTVKLPPVPQNSKEAIEAYKQIDARKRNSTINY